MMKTYLRKKLVILETDNTTLEMTGHPLIPKTPAKSFKQHTHCFVPSVMLLLNIKQLVIQHHLALPVKMMLWYSKDVSVVRKNSLQSGKCIRLNQSLSLGEKAREDKDPPHRKNRKREEIKGLVLLKAQECSFWELWVVCFFVFLHQQSCCCMKLWFSE